MRGWHTDVTHGRIKAALIYPLLAIYLLCQTHAQHAALRGKGQKGLMSAGGKDAHAPKLSTWALQNKIYN